jgi:hypothetical protein
MGSAPEVPGQGRATHVAGLDYRPPFSAAAAISKANNKCHLRALEARPAPIGFTPSKGSWWTRRKVDVARVEFGDCYPTGHSVSGSCRRKRSHSAAL